MHLNKKMLEKGEVLSERQVKGCPLEKKNSTQGAMLKKKQVIESRVYT